MQVIRTTTVQQFIAGSGWELGSGSPLALGNALQYFLEHVPLPILNRLDTSSPWGPPGAQRTLLVSWLQAIDFTHPVNPLRQLRAKERVKQVRLPGDPLTAKGDWFTWLSSDVERMALPDGQSADRIYEVSRPITCLESRVADAFAGWTRLAAGRDYRHGGAVQLFVYRFGLETQALTLVGGAKPR